MRLVPRRQREYLFSHPLAFWFSFGLTIAAFISLVAPDLAASSAAAVALPPWLLFVFRVIYFAGGAAATIGILRGLSRFEALGMMLIASGLLSQFVAAVYVRPQTFAASIFLIFLALGCASRSYFLTQRRYKMQTLLEQLEAELQSRRKAVDE